MSHYNEPSYIIFSLHYTEASFIALALHYRPHYIPRYSPGGLRAGAGPEQRRIQQPPLY